MTVHKTATIRIDRLTPRNILEAMNRVGVDIDTPFRILPSSSGITTFNSDGSATFGGQINTISFSGISIQFYWNEDEEDNEQG